VGGVDCKWQTRASCFWLAVFSLHTQKQWSDIKNNRGLKPRRPFMKEKIRNYALVLMLILGGIVIIQFAHNIVRNFDIAVSRPETAIAIARTALNDGFSSSDTDFEDLELRA